MGRPQLEFALSVVKRNLLTKTIIRWLNYSSTTILIIVIPVTDPQEKTDSLTIKQNSDGSYEINWDKEDPNWSWMNSLTSSEIQIIIQQAIQDYTADK